MGPLLMSAAAAVTREDEPEAREDKSQRERRGGGRIRLRAEDDVVCAGESFDSSVHNFIHSL